MYLNPTEDERLRISAAADLARKVLARGLQLNAPEATALICDEMHLAARAGGTFEEVLEAGHSAIREDQLLEGVTDLIDEIRVEVLLEEGSRLVVLRRAPEQRPPDSGTRSAPRRRRAS